MLPRILFVEHSAEIIGGGQISAFHLAKGLRDRGYPVALVLPGRGSFYELVKSGGFEPFLLRIPRLKGTGVRHLPKAVKGLGRVIRGFRADILHANASRGALVAGLAARVAGVPMIWHQRVPESEFFYDLFLYLLSTKIVAISGHVCRRTPYSRKTAVVYNGVKPAAEPKTGALRALRRRYHLGSDPVVGTLAQLTPSKGLAFFLQVGRRILDQEPKARFLIVGGEVEGCSGYRRRLEAISRRLDMEDRVVFTGFQSNPYDHLMLMDCFLFFPEREGFGRAVAEAMMASVPVVAAAVGGVPEIVGPGKAGVLIKPGDLSAAAKCAVRLLNDPELRSAMGKKGKDRAMLHFSAEAHLEKMCAVYDEVRNRSAQRRRTHR